MRFDDGRALIATQQGEYLADGQTVRRVMIDGTQIPGQAAGLNWAGTFNGSLWAVNGRGAVLNSETSQSGGRTRTFVGELDGSPLYMAPLEDLWNGRITATGLRWTIIGGAVLSGPFDGPLQTLIPAGYTPPGRSPPGSSRMNQYGGVNGTGAVSVIYTPNDQSYSYHDVLVADTNGIRVAASSGTIISTDRGAFLSYSVNPASQPLPDGSVFINADLEIDGTFRNALWLSHPDGSNTVVAMENDRAPGTESGLVFDPNYFFPTVCANRSGSLLFNVRLAGPGLNTSNDEALYLWRRGILTLIVRERPGLSVTYALPAGASCLNEADEVGFIGGTEVLLFKPGVGTVSAARLDAPLPPSAGIGGNVAELRSGFGNNAEPRTSGGDDDRVQLLSPEGRMFVLARTQSRSGPLFALSLEITEPGCPADFNLDGFTDFFDYLDFVTCFEGGRCPDGKIADFNDDGMADFFDYMAFVEAFETGC